MAENTQFNYGPETLSEVSSLSIRAIQLVEGLLSGHHRSPHKGSSVEFAEYTHLRHSWHAHLGHSWISHLRYS